MLLTAMLPLMSILAWRRDDLQLRPQGLVEHGPLGTSRVPWEALRPGHPWRPALDATTLPLTIDRPDLVRRRGWRRGGRNGIAVRDVHPWFLADTIRFYVDNPAERASIGTAEGYQRLQYISDAHARRDTAQTP